MASSSRPTFAERPQVAVNRFTDDVVALFQTRDGGEGVLSFVERRPANFVGA